MEAVVEVSTTYHCAHCKTHIVFVIRQRLEYIVISIADLIDKTDNCISCN